ncbi:MAG: hypothetical protein HZB43_12615 [candidate division Zixibacteria bacterium]|nr:hypothetical protein [candidate division Zixibacteria bacterium]
MSQKANCWEIKNCGRGPGGAKVAEMGVCPASTDVTSNGHNSGKNGGRLCWAVAGTFCGGKVQGSFADKQLTCMNCDVFKRIKQEEGHQFLLLKPNQTLKKAPVAGR